MKALRHILISFGLAGYVFLAVFGLMAMSHVHHHDMSSMGSNCTFMIGEQALCTMDFTAHIAMWENLTTSILGTLLWVVVPFLFVFFTLTLRPPNFTQSRLYEKPYRERFIARLFSQGILNPKAP
jgi:hypothetical protein